MEIFPTVLCNLIEDYVGPQYEFSFPDALNDVDEMEGKLINIFNNLLTRSDSKMVNWLFRQFDQNGEKIVKLIKVAFNLCEKTYLIQEFQTKFIKFNYDHINDVHLSKRIIDVIDRINRLLCNLLRNVDDDVAEYIYMLDDDVDKDTQFLLDDYFYTVEFNLSTII